MPPAAPRLLPMQLRKVRVFFQLVYYRQDESGQWAPVPADYEKDPQQRPIEEQINDWVAQSQAWLVTASSPCSLVAERLGPDGRPLRYMQHGITVIYTEAITDGHYQQYQPGGAAATDMGEVAGDVLVADSSAVAGEAPAGPENPSAELSAAPQDIA